MIQKIFHNLPILLLIIISLVNAQLLDAVLEFPIETAPAVIPTTDGFISKGTVNLPDSTMQLSGVAMRLVSSGIVSVFFAVGGKDEQDKIYKETQLFFEPFSNRITFI